MTTAEKISLGSLIVSALSLIISVFWSWRNSKSSKNATVRAEEANRIANEANQVAHQANALSKEANLLAAGDSETAIRADIRTAWQLVNDVRTELAGITQGRLPNKLNADEKRMLESANNGFKAAVEQVCNAYETACRRYIDGKCDKAGFRKLFNDEIRTLIQNPTEAFQQVLKPGPQSKHQAILRVYDEWHNLEKA